MAVKSRTRQMILSGAILILMLVCAIFGWHRSHYSSALHLAFYALLLLNSFLVYRRNADKAMPDTLTQLFPTVQEARRKTQDL